MRTVICCVVLLASWIIAACDAEEPFPTLVLEVEQVHWDTLDVNVSYTSFRRGGTPPSPANERVQIFDSEYNLLHDGSPGRVTIPDPHLKDQDRITIEACSSFNDAQRCEMTYVEASPKRLGLTHDIEYPLDAQFSTGRYEFDFVVERQKFEREDEWEFVRRVDEPLDAYMMVSLDDSADLSVRVPVQERSGSFRLDRLRNHLQFEKYLLSVLAEQDSAAMYFKIRVQWNGQEWRLPTITRMVHRRPPRLRADEARYYATQAGRRLREWRAPFWAGRQHRTSVLDWRYNADDRAYEIRMRVQWADGVLQRVNHDVEGTLFVIEDGTLPIFRIRRMNRPVRVLWQRSAGDILQLGTSL